MSKRNVFLITIGVRNKKIIVEQQSRINNKVLNSYDKYYCTSMLMMRKMTLLTPIIILLLLLTSISGFILNSPVYIRLTHLHTCPPKMRGARCRLACSINTVSHSTTQYTQHLCDHLACAHCSEKYFSQFDIYYSI